MGQTEAFSIFMMLIYTSALKSVQYVDYALRTIENVTTVRRLSVHPSRECKLLDCPPDLSLDQYSYLTSVERRLHKLESLFAELLPDVNLEDMLASSTTTLPTPVAAQGPTHSTINRTTSAQEEDDMSSVALPDKPDGSNWRVETTNLNDLADGMASFSIEPTGTGYLGGS